MEAAADCSVFQGSSVDGVERRPAATCSICMEPWTSYGDHRVCCLPCGHVYGLLCLQKCLLGSLRRADCPHCGQTHRIRDIIKLRKDCCHRKEIEELKLSIAESVMHMRDPLWLQWQQMREWFRKVLKDQAAPLSALRRQVEALKKKTVKVKEQGTPAIRRQVEALKKKTVKAKEQGTPATTNLYRRLAPGKRKLDATNELISGEVPRAAGTGSTQMKPTFLSSQEKVVGVAMADQVTPLEALIRQVEALRLRTQTMNMKERGELARDCHCRQHPRKRRSLAIGVPQAAGTGETKTNPAFLSSEEEAVAAAMAEGDGVGHSQQPAAFTCCICMQPWTSNGDHQICCLPCGHVYGRCCLEKFLCPCRGHSAECPQCGRTYAQKDIINLRSTNLWDDDCCHKEEIEQFKLSLADNIIQIGLRAWQQRHELFEKVISDQMASHEALRIQIGALREQMVDMKEQGCGHFPHRCRPPSADVLFGGLFPQAAGAFSSSKEGALELQPPSNCFSFCMQRWSSKQHQFYWLPCGHVYDRCCLEEWLCPCGKHSVKCSGCCLSYTHNDIINLCSPKLLWNDDCGHKEEIEQFKLSLGHRIIMKSEQERRQMHKQFEEVINNQAASLEALWKQLEDSVAVATS